MRRSLRFNAAQSTSGELLRGALVFVACFALVFGFVRPVVAAPSVVEGPSMQPTLQTGDRVLVNKLGYRFGNPERGDVVLLRGDDGDLLIKRVAATGGETVAARGGNIYVDGEPLREPYALKAAPAMLTVEPTTVPPGHVYVLGDNRGNSTDSRYFGPVPQERLAGEAVAILWPPDSLSEL